MAPNSRSMPFDTESTTKWDYASHPSRSPPRTPPLRVSRAAKGKGPGRGPRARPALHDTFFDDGNARGSKGTRPLTNKRDSHDLSWSPKQTRDSVVDNMLLSLDQLFVGGGGGSPSQGSNPAVYSAIDENYSVAPRRDVGRQRGHTFSSSLSSDYNMSLAGSITDYPNLSPRSHRRNNSGSNFQSGLQRIDSVYVDDDYGRVLDEKFLETGRAIISEDRIGRPRHSGRKGSKSSGSSSLDFGQTLGGPRWQRSVERRSSSLDHAYEKHGALPLTFNTYSHHSPSISRSQFDYNDFDEAAPTPTVPAGPRRNRSPPPTAMFGPAIPYAPQMPPSTSSNVTLRRKSSLTHYAKYQSRLAKAEKPTRTSSKQPIKYGKSQVPVDVNDASVVAAFRDDPSASPAAPPFKAIETTPRSASIPARERPGFFKRVFGSSWSSNASPKPAPLPLPPPPHQVSISSRNSIRSESRNGQAASAPLVSRHSRSQGSGSVPASTKDLPPLPLNKKSSFFRRRKKSVSGEMPLPPVPPQIHTELQEPVKAVQEIEPSPVSSLREVMKPFLNRPSSAQLLDKDLGIHDVAYLAGYAARNESSRKLPVSSHRRTASDSAFVDGGRDEKLALLEWETPKAKVDPKLAPHESSYLHDSSSTNESVEDQQIPKARPVAENIQPHHQIVSPPPSNAGNDASTPHANDARPAVKASTSDDKAVVAIHEDLPAKQMPLQPVDANVANSDATVTTPKKPEPKYIVTPVRISSKRNSASLPTSPNRRASRLWLDPISTTDVTEKPKQPSTPEYAVPNSARQSIATIEDFKSASSQLASPVYETPITRDAPAQTVTESSVEAPVETFTEATLEVPNTETIDAALDAPEFDPTLPTEHDRLLAKQIYDGTNEEIKPKAAPWLGDVGSERARVRRAYMELFDWQNLNILAGLRALCNRLFLKGETQQIDRILTAFSTRWCECNPNHGFKATGELVH